MTTTTAPTTPINIPTMPDPLVELAALTAGEAPPVDSATDPRAAEEYAFTVDMTFANGQRLVGGFKNKILTPQERVNVSLLITKLSRGVLWSTIDDDGQYLLTVIAHLSVSLSEKPKWFNFASMKHMPLLTAVYKEVSSHEEFFRGPQTVAAPRSEG